MTRTGTGDLTSTQLAMLRTLDAAALSRDVERPDEAWLGGDDLVRLLYGNHTTPQGAHQTAASLVRRGYAQRAHCAERHVIYHITEKGREYVYAAASLARLT